MNSYVCICEGFTEYSVSYKMNVLIDTIYSARIANTTSYVNLVPNFVGCKGNPVKVWSGPRHGKVRCKTLVFNRQPLDAFGEGESLQMSPSPETCHVCKRKYAHEEMGRALEAMHFGFHVGICSIVISIALRPRWAGCFLLWKPKEALNVSIQEEQVILDKPSSIQGEWSNLFGFTELTEVIQSACHGLPSRDTAERYTNAV